MPCTQHRTCRTVGQWNCDYFDDIESLAGFGAANKESLAELVWAFFEYWAWRHDYNNSVVSVRTGGFLTKSQKEWTRRVGNERHLVCIEVSVICMSRGVLYVYALPPSLGWRWYLRLCFLPAATAHVVVLLEHCVCTSECCTGHADMKQHQPQSSVTMLQQQYPCSNINTILLMRHDPLQGRNLVCCSYQLKDMLSPAGSV